MLTDSEFTVKERIYRENKALHYKKYYDKLNIKLKICGVGDFLHRICFTKLNLQIL